MSGTRDVLLALDFVADRGIDVVGSAFKDLLVFPSLDLVAVHLQLIVYNN